MVTFFVNLHLGGDLTQLCGFKTLFAGYSQRSFFRFLLSLRCVYLYNYLLTLLACLAAAAAAKLLQLCPTLCDPIDGSPPDFPAPGNLQARTLEWVAISFSNWHVLQASKFNGIKMTWVLPQVCSSPHLKHYLTSCWSQESETYSSLFLTSPHQMHQHDLLVLPQKNNH